VSIIAEILAGNDPVLSLTPWRIRISLVLEVMKKAFGNRTGVRWWVYRWRDI